MHRSRLLAPVCLAATAALLPAALRADTVTLTNGDVLQGTIVSENNAQVVIDHPHLGQIQVGREYVASVSKETSASSTSAPSDAPSAESPESAIGSLNPFAIWSGSLTAGLNGSEGKTQTLAIRVAFDAKRETDHDRTTLQARYTRTEDDGNVSANKIKLEAVQDWFREGSSLFYFVKGTYEYDEFAAWDNRLTALAGLGYTFVKQEKLEITGRAGLGMTAELGGTSDDDVFPEAFFGGTLVRWHFAKNHNLTAYVDYYPNLEDWGRFRLNSGVEWSFRIPDTNNMTFKVGVENEHESFTVDDTPHNDFRYYAAVGIEF